jgi:hypothetical protein
MSDDLESLLQSLEETETPVLEAGKAVVPDKIIPVLDNVEQEVLAVPDNPIDINKKMAQLDSVTQDVLESCKSDRMQAQEAIDIIRGEIDKKINENRSPSSTYMEVLIKAIEVKSGINQIAVKMMEANAKMISSTKASGTNVSVNNINAPSLTDVLSKPPEDYE